MSWQILKNHLKRWPLLGLPTKNVFSEALTNKAPFAGRPPFVLGLVILAVVAYFAVAIPANINRSTLTDGTRQLSPAGPPEANSASAATNERDDLPSAQREILGEIAAGEKAPAGSGEPASKPGVGSGEQPAASKPPSGSEDQPTAPKPSADTVTVAREAPVVDAGAAGEPAREVRPAPRGIVVVDPGHGGRDSGASRKFLDGFQMKESDLNLKVSLILAKLLKNEGFQVVLTRDADAPVNAPAKDRTGDGVISGADELQARVDIANDARADLFVSVHFNSAASQMGGTEVFYCANRPFSDKSRQAARFLQDNLLKGVRSLGYDPPNSGVKVDTQSGAGTHLYVLGPRTSNIAKPIAMPSILGEGLFISNIAEGNLLRNDKTLNEIAEAYRQAVVEFFDWLRKS